MTNEIIERIEDSFLGEMNERAGLGRDARYDTHRIMLKTRITKSTLNSMIERARMVSDEIRREKNSDMSLYGGYNENYPFDVIAAYFRI